MDDSFDAAPEGAAADPAAARTAERLHSVAIHLLRSLRRHDAASGVSAPQLSALSVLVFGGPRSIGALAAAEGVRPPSMTRVVDTLERDGLALRERDPVDGRSVHVRATERGRRVLLEGRGRRVAALTSQLATLPADEQDVVARAVAVLERMLRGERPASSEATSPLPSTQAEPG